jgi:diaminohydroxyphosphoribosylaminopyrimidine deaminase/5-amino-6-(5-phosphoribosylamino)uracil reductase
MERAIELAREGLSLAHPNPMVGCVIVKDGAVVGRGYHLYDERDHAEIVALRQAGKDARGATLYVSLEPCCHTGRTGPCTKAIIDAGVGRVVTAMEDPNPRVAGQGIAQLREAGIPVCTGVEEEEALRLNEDFAYWIRTGLPFVTLKAALTLDGQIAMRPGHETPITGGEAREAVQRLRHSADAIVTGIGTVLADDPLLTDRTGLRRRRKLLRVVMDSKLRLPPKSKFVQSAEGDVLVVARQSPDRAADAKKSAALERAGVEVMRAGSAGGHVSFKELLKELGKRQIVNLLIEAGSELNGAAIAGGFVHKMVLFYAPKIMGTGGVPFAQIPSTWFRKAPSLSRLTLHGFGRDFAVEGYFQDVYRDNGTDGKN